MEEQKPNKKEKQTQLMLLKTRMPKVSECLVKRDRLIERLENAGRDIIIFHAGAGYGKTTVMAELARKYSSYSGWYRLDESDNEPHSFLMGLTVMFSSIMETDFLKVKDFNLLAEEDIEESYEKFLESILLRLPENEVYLCFDNFDAITNEIIYDFMQKMIEYASGKIKMLFGIRGKVPAFLSSYLMRGEAEIICSGDLCFCKEETSLLLRKKTSFELTEQNIISIQEYTQGWPAGIVFVGLSLKAFPKNIEQDFIFDGTHLYNYIFHEIFQKISNEIQQFMISISVFETVDPLVCDYVFGQCNSLAMLDKLVRENLFLHLLKGESRQYRYVSVFAGFLRDRIKPERHIRILLKASEYYMHHHNWEKAAHYAIGCGEKGYEIVSELLEQRIFAMLEEGNEGGLELWIAYLKEGIDQLKERTLFLIYHFYRHKGRDKEAIQMLCQAAEKSYVNLHYELYAGYMCELIAYSRISCGIMCAEEYAEEAEKRLIEKVTSYYPKIICCHVEFRLQMEDKTQLKQFLEMCRDKNQRRRYHLEEIRRMVQWAMNLENDFSNWEEIITEARFAARISRVYAEYGFYRVVFFLYWSGNEKWIDLAVEGLQIGGDSVFFHWMHLLLLLWGFKRETGNRYEVVKKINYKEKYRKLQGIDFPEFKAEDRKNLELILCGTIESLIPLEKISKKNLLKIVCLGAFSVEGKDGEIAWRTRKTKELFACLFFEEGRGIEKNVLMDRLWPDTSVKKASTLFHTTVSYLRKALAQVGALELLNVKNGVYAIEMERVSSDIESLIRLNRGMEADKKNNPVNITWILEMYHGCYMHGDDYPWLGSHREYVEQIFLQTLGTLAVRKIEAKEYAKAVLLLQKAVDVDCYTVSLWELLIECLILSGDMIGAKKQFKKMEKICLDELDHELDMDFHDYVVRSQLLCC